MKNPTELQTAGGRVIFIRTPKQLSASQLVLALGSMDDNDPRWLAINQILDQELAAAALDVSAPTCDNRDHAAGRMEGLAILKQRLDDCRRKPMPEKVEPRKKR